jgi:hypothetical protein
MRHQRKTWLAVPKPQDMEVLVFEPTSVMIVHQPGRCAPELKTVYVQQWLLQNLTKQRAP